MMKLLIVVLLVAGCSAESVTWLAHTTIPVRIASDNFSALCAVSDVNVNASTAFQWLNGTSISPKSGRYLISLIPLTNQTLLELLANATATNWTLASNVSMDWEAPASGNAWFAQITILSIAHDEVGGLLCANRSELAVGAYAYVKRGTGMKETKNVIQGDEFCLTCEAYGSPLPTTVVWSKNGAPLVTDNRVKLLDVANKTQNATLSFEPVEYEDDADYACYAENEHGIGNNVTMALRVKDRWAALWPFVGIVIEVIVLCAVILLYEKRQQAKMEEDDKDESTLMNDPGAANERDEHDGLANGADEMRHRPIIKS